MSLLELPVSSKPLARRTQQRGVTSSVKSDNVGVTGEEISVTPLRQRMLEELQRRNYSSETIRGYIFAVREFAEQYSKPPEALGAEELRH